MYDTSFTLIEQYNSDYESIFSGFKLYLTIILIHNILTNLPMKNTYNTVKASDINNLLAKSEKKENELVIPTFLQSRMKK